MVIKCGKCSGRAFIDRVFSDNLNFELFCVICGDRKFVKKSSALGQLIDESERRLKRERVL